MRDQALEISTDVFRILQDLAPVDVTWSEEKPGPTQRILVEYDLYTQLIDRAIDKRKTLDQIILEVCVAKRTPNRAAAQHPRAFGRSLR